MHVRDQRSRPFSSFGLAAHHPPEKQLETFWNFGYPYASAGFPRFRLREMATADASGDSHFPRNSGSENKLLYVGFVPDPGRIANQLETYTKSYFYWSGSGADSAGGIPACTGSGTCSATCRYQSCRDGRRRRHQ